MTDSNYPYGNTFSQRDNSKPENQLIPKSMANSGADLDSGCGEIKQSDVPGLMDSHKSSIPTSPVDKVIRRKR